MNIFIIFRREGAEKYIFVKYCGMVIKNSFL
jgi:hypothetical protein